jgi:hypothetical protein
MDLSTTIALAHGPTALLVFSDQSAVSMWSYTRLANSTTYQEIKKISADRPMSRKPRDVG